MKMSFKKFGLPVLASVCALAAVALADGTEKGKLPYAVYDEDGNESAYIPSGYMGNYDAIKMAGDCTETPHAGKTCIKVQYTANDNWGGVVWQSPANDWGEQPGGLDLTGAKKLIFWARGAKGNEVASFSYGTLGKGHHKYYDSSKAEMKDVALTKEWKQFTIDLDGKDLSCIKSGFCWVVGGKGEPMTFFLDDIHYE